MKYDLTNRTVAITGAAGTSPAPTQQQETA